MNPRLPHLGSVMSEPASLVADALLFDLDGVLVDSQRAVQEAMAHWAVSVGLDPEEVLARCPGRRDVDLVRELLPTADPAAEAAAIADIEAVRTESVVPIRGAAALLRDLGPTGWAVVTSSARRVAQARLTAAGLPRPPLLIGAEDVPSGKPHPLPFLHAAARLGIPPSRCIVFEDSEAGLRAADRAGMRCISIGPTALSLGVVTVSRRDLSDVTLIRPPMGLRRFALALPATRQVQTAKV